MNRIKNISAYILAFLFPIVLLALLYATKGIYPFGETSNYIWDLEIQYTDFFCYFKDILAGNSGVEYTFSQSLGSSPVALIGYYLMSPINLLLVFFKKSQMQLFVYVAASLKLGLCGLTCYTFMRRRFCIPNKFCLLLSLAFSFTQYAVGQVSNIMWLDGVYMLPLIMLGIYLHVKEGKNLLFYVATALSIVFCWYIGYMNCIFAVFYYLFERTLCETKFKFKEQSVKFFRFVCLEFLSVLLSCAVFLPVMLRQSTGRGLLDEGVFNFTTNGRLLEILKGFALGSAFPDRQITLFCSVAVLLFFFSFWFSKRASKKEKTAAGLLLGVMVASLFFKPIENIWCGFKFEDSYMYRFAYLAFMVVILISAMQIEKLYRDGTFDLSDKSLLFGGVTFILILLVADWVNGIYDRALWFEIALILFYIAVLYFESYRGRINLQNTKRFMKLAVTACFAVVFLLEVILNAVFVVGNSYEFNAQRTSNYISEQEKLIESVKKYDNSFYRMEQTSSRYSDNVNGFYANESLAYGYSGIQTYTSCYDGLVSEILVDSGYCTSYFPTFYYAPILPMDSFLGVKYLLSSNEYLGYEKTDISPANQKNVYYNPYALPLGFKVEDTVFDNITHNNSFEYVNALYSSVLGEKVEVFKRVENILSEQNGNQLVYRFDDSEKVAGSIVYVSFEHYDIMSEALCVNGEAVSSYNRPVWGTWNNLSYLGDIQNIKEVSLQGCNLSLQDANAQFYYVDMSIFADSITKLKSGAIELSEITDGYLKAIYSAEQDGQVMLTIPYDERWTVKVNGEKVDFASGVEQFIVIPVSEGSNEIEMEYSIKGKLAGVAATFASIVIFAGIYVVRKKRPEKAV